jgi:hypothetical protein
MNALQKSIPNRCAGKSCQEFGIHLLRVIYLNRLGWFCNSCRDILVSAGIAVDSQLKPESSEVTIVTDVNRGEKKKDEKNQENSLH